MSFLCFIAKIFNGEMYICFIYSTMMVISWYKIKYIPWFLILLLSVLLIGFTFYKALFTSFTHDESFTYTYFVNSSFTDILTYKFVSPNNHLLNTLLMKFFGSCIGNSEIILRLPNILSHIGYIIFSFLIFRRLNGWLILPLFALLNLNPYFLDFFSLARGNGLSYFFLLGSVFFFMEYSSSFQKKYYLFSILFAFLGVLSHFALLNYFLALIVVFNLWLIIRKPIRKEALKFNLKQWIRQNDINIIGIILLTALLYVPISKLVMYHQLFYGGERGFWIDTVGSLIKTSLYGCRYGMLTENIIKVFILMSLFGNVFLFGFFLIRKEREFLQVNQFLFLIFLLLIFTVLINMAQFYLVGTKLLIRRYGLLFFPLFMLDFCFLMVALIRIVSLKYMVSAIIYLLASFVTFHTFSAFSQVNFLDWEYETDTREMVNVLRKEIPKHSGDDSVVLGITWVYSPTINFYKDIYNLKWLKATDKENPLPQNATYFWMQKEDLSKIPIVNRHIKILYDSKYSILVKVY